MKQRPIVSKGLPQTVSDGAVCLRKFHCFLHNILIINIDKLFQRGRILIVRYTSRVIPSDRSSPISGCFCRYGRDERTKRPISVHGETSRTGKPGADDATCCGRNGIRVRESTGSPARRNTP